MHTNGYIQRGIYLCGSFEDQERDMGCLIFPILVRPAQLPINRVIDQQTRQIINRLIIGHPPGGRSPFIIGPEQCVNLSSGSIPVVCPGRQMIPDNPLARFTQTLRRLVHNGTICLCHGKQIVTSFRIWLFSRQTFRLDNMPGDPTLDATNHAPRANHKNVAVPEPYLSDDMPQSYPADLPTPGFKTHLIIWREMRIISGSHI